MPKGKPKGAADASSTKVNMGGLWCKGWMLMGATVCLYLYALQKQKRKAEAAEGAPPAKKGAKQQVG